MQDKKTNDKQQVGQDILDHLKQLLAGNEVAQNLQLDTDLIAGGLLDSLNIVRLIQFMEARFVIYMDDDDISPELFESVNSLAEYVLQQK